MDITSSNRERRANEFTNQIMHMLRDYLPPGRDVRRMIHDQIWEIAHGHNLEIISVPAEFDALTKLELERRMVETHPYFIATSPIAEPPQTDQTQELQQVQEAPPQ